MIVKVLEFEYNDVDLNSLTCSVALDENDRTKWW